ncbi:MAG: hypothetical protein Q9192_000972 [Flavoplaca navasiana]
MLFSSTGIAARTSFEAVEESIHRGWSVVNVPNTTLEPSSGKRSSCGVWTLSMLKPGLLPLRVPAGDNAPSHWQKGRPSFASSKSTSGGRDRPVRPADSTRGTEL